MPAETAVYPTNEVEEITPAQPPVSASPTWFSRLGRWFDAFVGAHTIVFVLAVISAIPLLNLLSLGYLLTASRSVAETGRLRNGFPGLYAFARLGKIILCVWLWLLPLRLTYDLWLDANLIESGSAQAAQLKGSFVVLSILIGGHLLWAIARGGRFRDFLWPAPIRFFRWLWNPQAHALKAWHWRAFPWNAILRGLKTGCYGFAGGAIWLAPGISLMFLAANIPQPGPSALCSLLGGGLLGGAALILPFLQTHAAVTGKFPDHFAVPEVRKRFQRAPLAFCLALIVSLLFAVPLYLLKIELAPQEVEWLANLIFVLSIYPARLAVGWAYGRSLKREDRRLWLWRWLAFFAVVPVIGAYVMIVWLAQYFSWHGSLSLLEQHAFLIPAPLLGL